MTKVEWSNIISKNPAPDLTIFNQGEVMDNRFNNYNGYYNSELLEFLTTLKNFEITSKERYDTDTPWSLSEAEKEENFATHYLRKENFSRGTYRIIKPGLYILKDDIEFNPVPDPAHPNSFMPTNDQIKNGDYPTAAGLSPGGETGYYHMGFFAAITIEADGVILDLGGKTIKQSPLHQLQQRFFACIETASAPFIQAPTPANPDNSTGPSQFGPTAVRSGSNVYIGNGKLLSSSHHSIHGNRNTNILIENLTLANFEVGGIQLNGSKNTIIRCINICNGSDDVRVPASYSQARFLLPFLDQIKSSDPNFKLDFKPDSPYHDQGNIETILDNLTSEMKLIQEKIASNEPIPPESIFFMEGSLIDGNRYGIVLAQLGPVVGAFQKTRRPDGLNENVVVHDIMIDNLETKPQEVIGVSRDKNMAPEMACCQPYAGGRATDAVAGVLDILKIQKDNAYLANVLSQGQFIVQEAVNKGIITQNTKTSIPDEILHWALSGTSTLDNIIKGDGGFYYVGLGDSMAHVMKGDIGLFLQGMKGGLMSNITINNMKNHSTIGLEFAQQPGYIRVSGIYAGTSNTGIAVISCENIMLNNICIEHIKSVAGVAQGIKCQGANENINICNYKFADIQCAKPSRQGTAPNPEVTCDFIYIDENCYDNISLKSN